MFGLVSASGKNLEIMVELVQVYGQQQVYPRCPKAEIFARLAGTKTLTPRAIEDIKALGYTVYVVHPYLPDTL